MPAVRIPGTATALQVRGVAQVIHLQPGRDRDEEMLPGDPVREQFPPAEGEGAVAALVDPGGPDPASVREYLYLGQESGKGPVVRCDLPRLPRLGGAPSPRSGFTTFQGTGYRYVRDILPGLPVLCSHRTKHHRCW